MERHFVKCIIPISESMGSVGGIDLIAPSIDHGIVVEVVNELDDALFQFVFRVDADVTKDGARGFGKKALDKIEPGPSLGVNTNWKRS